VSEVRVLHLADELPEEYLFEHIRGRLLGDDAYDVLLTEDADVYMPSGELLLKFRKGVLNPSLTNAAYLALRGAAALTTNRGVAAGAVEVRPGDTFSATDRRVVAETSLTRLRPMKQDGTISNTTYAQPVESGIVGFFDRNVRFPYCRQTAFNINEGEKFASAYPYIREVDGLFASLVPDRHGVQMGMVRSTHPDFVISGTSFTTVTVNRNWQTAVHKDVGDLKAGFGVLTAFAGGVYTGCYFTFPAFRVAVDLRSGDILCADVHQWHGNTPFHGRRGKYERVSCVFYYREHMHECGSAEEELNRAKRRQKGDKLLGPVSRGREEADG